MSERKLSGGKERKLLLLLLGICIASDLGIYTSNAAFSLPAVGGSPSSDSVAPADSAPPADSTAPANASGGSSSQPRDATAGGSLQGTVEKSEANAEAILGELKQTVRYIKDASWGAFVEAQRPDVMFVGGANVIGGVVINPVGVGGVLPTGGYLPPRKKWIDYFAMHVNYLAPILKQELESFEMPAGVSADTMTDYQEYKKLATRLPELCEKMLSACQGPKYDNMTITVASGMLHEELKRYDKIREELYKDIREDFKRTDAEKTEEEKQLEKKEKEELKEKEKEQLKDVEKSSQ